MSEKTENTSTAITKVIYILLIVSTIIGFSGIVAVIMAYVNQEDSPDWLQTHHRFQIRTFWIGLLYACVGIFTFGIGIGYFIILFTVVWIIVRCIKGLKQLEKNQSVKNLESWMFT